MVNFSKKPKEPQYCRYGCGTQIYFSYVDYKAIEKWRPFSKETKQVHDCKLSYYNRNKREREANGVPCKNNCGGFLDFDQSIRSHSGKMIPLVHGTKEHNECPNSDYSKARQQIASDKKYHGDKMGGL